MNKIFNIPSETTPLSSIPAIIGDPKVKELASAALSRGKDLYQLAAKGNASLRVIVMITALAVSLTSFMGLTTCLLTLNLTGAIMDVYCTVFGLLVALIESGKIPNVRRVVSTYFYFLDFANGRSGFYVFLGTLKMTQVCVI
jgi:hypothetical protein